jgi:uncharacterized protein (AIM24 family)
MCSHEVDHTTHGDDLQFVEIEMVPGQSVKAEAGSMMDLMERVAPYGSGSSAGQGSAVGSLSTLFER